MNELTLGISTCPNDTYIFDALIHKKIEHDILLGVRLEDVETLNQWAVDSVLDVSKVSIHGWFHVIDQYRLLASGGAVGRGCGPLLISRRAQKPKSGKIALPGERTSASLLFKLAVDGDFDFCHMPFNEIIPAILSNQADAGVIIHESRFSYQDVGLKCVIDLGQWWEETTGCLIPLGGIIVSNRLEKALQLQIQTLIRQSVIYAGQNPHSAMEYVRRYAQEIEDTIIQNHIDLYVNEYSVDLGPKGTAAIQTLYRVSVEKGLLPRNCLNKENQLFI